MKGETLLVDENTAMEDLAKAVEEQDHLQDELKGFHKNLDNANMEVNSCRDKLNTATVELNHRREGLDCLRRAQRLPAPAGLGAPRLGRR